jgi:squalene-hopene/tetraprenyl-beta-curcumene cyclase
VTAPAPAAEKTLAAAIDASRDYLLSVFVHADAEDGRASAPDAADLGYWHGELEADSTLESDYILFLYCLDAGRYREKIAKLARRVMNLQLEDGSWNIYYDGPGEISASVKAYFALKLAGCDAGDPVLLRAREAIHRLGGAERVNSFTRIYLSFFGQVDWRDCPAIPPELVLLPRSFPFNIYEMSYWSRAILVPLSILFAMRPTRTLPAEKGIAELFLQPHGRPGAEPSGPLPQEGLAWRRFFLLVDKLAKVVEQTPLKPLRSLALRRAEEWIITRFQSSDGLGAIFPSMVNSVLALRSLGYRMDHPFVAYGLETLAELELDEGDHIRVQPCLSPVWDTALALNALGEAGLPEEHPIARKAVRWLVSKEVSRPGDWQLRRPGVPAGGWYFQFQNEFYPDIDDTAAVLMALERFSLAGIPGAEGSVRRGLNWILSMQSSSGGWAAFDADVEREFLTRVPFADHNAMLDPACSDITGRILECLGRFPTIMSDARVRASVTAAVAYLRRTQTASGAWWGRWGVNHIYGTWQSLKGLTSVGVPPDDPAVERAAAWLLGRQNDDGGWGESCASYEEGAEPGRGRSTASQTAWAVMGLIAAGKTRAPAVARGIDSLLRTQNDDGSWTELDFTGTGFPLVFYLRYHLYSQYFPLFALASYRNAAGGGTARPLRTRLRLDRPGWSYFDAAEESAAVAAPPTLATVWQRPREELACRVAPGPRPRKGYSASRFFAALDAAAAKDPSEAQREEVSLPS